MRRPDDDFADEIAEHISLETERLIAEGRPPDEARAMARLRFGNVTSARERFYERRRLVWLDDLRADIRYALRSLRRAPGFATVAILTLALGIGANTAIFGVVYQTLIKPLPFPAADRLVKLESHIPQLAARFPTLPVAAQDFQFYRSGQHAFAGMAAVQGRSYNLAGSGEPERLNGARVSASFFPLLGVRPARGRLFLDEEDREGHEDVVLISDALWRRRFASDPAILSRNIDLNGRLHQIVGVLPANLMFPAGRQFDPVITFGPRVDVWKPVAFTRDELGQEGNFDFGVVALLKSGVTLETARQDLARLAGLNLDRIRAAAPEVPDDFDLRVLATPLHDVFTRGVRRNLLVLEGAVALLLLIATVNVANLLLVRMSGREREFATRAALGAPRWRLVRQVLTESLVLTTLGGVVGVWFAVWAGRVLLRYGPQTAASRPWMFDGPVIGFAAAATLAAGLLFGLLPALRATREAMLGRLKEAARAVSERRAGRTRRALVAIEVALCTALLALAGLLLHSFANVMRVDPGFAVERVLAVDLALPPQLYGPKATAPFYRTLVERVAARPGVAAAGVVSLLPIAHEGVISTILLEPDTAVRLDRPSALRRGVSPGLFAALDIPLLAGRTFAEQEPARAVLLSRSLAAALWPGEAPTAVIGRGVRLDPKDRLMTVIGIVGDTRADALDRDAPHVMYQHYAVMVRAAMTLVVRTDREPESVAAGVRADIAALDRNLPIAALRTMEEIVSVSMAERRFQMSLVSLFAVLALVLAVIGIYGVASFAVSRRTREIGLRVALGAGRAQVLRSVLLEGLTPVAIGALVGLGAGQLAAGVVRGVLFGVGPLDPLAMLGVVGVLTLTATLACYLPARSAARVDPTIALRAE